MATFKVGDTFCNHIHGYVIVDRQTRGKYTYLFVIPYHREGNHLSMLSEKRQKYGTKITMNTKGNEEVKLRFYTYCADGTWDKGFNGPCGYNESWMTENALHIKLRTYVKEGLHPGCYFKEGPCKTRSIEEYKKDKKRRVIVNVTIMDKPYDGEIIREYRLTDTFKFQPKHVKTGRVAKRLRDLIRKNMRAQGEKNLKFMSTMQASLKPFLSTKMGRVGVNEYFWDPKMKHITTKRLPTNQRKMDPEKKLSADRISSEYLVRLASASAVEYKTVHLKVWMCEY